MTKQSHKKKHTRSYSGLGHITERYRSSRELYQYLWSLSENLDLDGSSDQIMAQRKAYHRFLSHLYVSMNMQIKNETFVKREGFVPVYSRTIEQGFERELKVHVLTKIIDIKGHDTARHMSREFRLKEKIYEKAVRIECKSTLDAWADLCKGKAFNDHKLVNLMTGRIQPSVVKSQYTKDEGGIRNTNLPKLIKDSMKFLKPCPFNPKYVYKWVKDLEEKYNRERAKVKRIRKKYGEASEEYRSALRERLRAKGRYLNDLYCIGTILKQIPKKLTTESTEGDPLYQYNAAYSAQISGRLTEIGGGFQSANKYFKHIFFLDMKGMKKNYDLKSSQANILLQELRVYKIECQWLEQYLNDPDAKNKYAEKVGIPVELWKDCFYALFFGADVRSSKGAISDNMKEYFSGNIREAQKTQKRFMKIVSELVKATGKWRDYIYNMKDKRYLYQHGGIKYWKNACGMHFKIYGIRKDNEGKPVLIDRMHGDKEIRSTQGINKCKRKLAAFILQGQEACLIHHLTILCSENGIPVYKNEHDGLITGKEIPDRLVQEASARSGLKNPVLKRKPLCPKNIRKDMKKYVGS